MTVTQSLRQKAQAKAAESWGENASADAETIAGHLAEAVTAPKASEPLPDIEYTDAITDAEQVPVHIAWARVMADVQSIAKGDQRADSGGKYNFRGVDRVVNAVGPALRRHGVLVLPTKVFDIEYRSLTTKNGGAMQECTLKVQWTITGPMGDSLPPCESAGQANDTADKGTAKAESVAQRVFFLTSLQIPTQDPTIDQGHDRGERPLPRAAEYVDEVCDPRTSQSRIRQIYQEAKRHNLLTASVTNEVGEPEELGALILRVDASRAGGQ